MINSNDVNDIKSNLFSNLKESDLVESNEPISDTLSFPAVKYGISLKTSFSPVKFEYYMDTATCNINTSNNVLVQEVTAENNGAFSRLVSLANSKVHPSLYELSLIGTSNQVLFIQIPKGASETITIDLPEKSTVSRFYVEVEDNATVTIKLNSSKASNVVHNVAMYILAKKNSSVHCFTNGHIDSGFFYLQRSAMLGQDSVVHWNDALFSQSNSVTHTTTFLDGRGASVQFKGCQIAANCATDAYIGTYHMQPDTKSDFIYRGLTYKNATQLQRGLVEIDTNAYNSDGYQQSDFLSLDQTAITNALPELKIGNSDVKCSHGATVSPLDSSSIFYLQSRGLDKKAAELLLLKGFLQEAIQNFSEEEKENVTAKMHNFHNNQVTQ